VVSRTFTGDVRGEKMRRFFQRIWRDIRRGESIDVYASVFLAVILAILSIIDVVPISWVASVTLGVLALLAFANLGSRHRLDEIHAKLLQDPEHILLRNFPPDMQANLEKASEVWAVGVTLGRTIDNHYALLEVKLRQGNSVKILVGDPNSEWIKIIPQHSYVPVTKDYVESRIRQTLNRLCKLQSVASYDIEIRVLDHPIFQGMFAFDPEKQNGSIYVEYYPFKMPQSSIPKLVLFPEDRHWYEFYKTQLHALWERAKPWNCENS
jgi:hypothetical protein